MKKLVLSLALISMFGVACEKDDADDGTTGTTTTQTPEEQIVGSWKGDTETFSVNITGAGANDTSYTQTNQIPHFNLILNSDGSGQTDSLGFDVDSLTWKIVNSNLMILDDEDTLTIDLLTSTNLNFSSSHTDNSNPPIVFQSDLSIKFTK